MKVKRDFRIIDELSSNLKMHHFVNLKKYYSSNQLTFIAEKGSLSV